MPIRTPVLILTFSPLLFCFIQSFQTSNVFEETQSHIFPLCKSNRWDQVLQCIQQDPMTAMTPLIMDNNISTTVLHQAISSKDNKESRFTVIRTALSSTPKAATIRNGYGSLPIHVICQRNTKMKSQIKEELIRALIHAYPESLLEAGGVGGRTPLHIVFTDYVSPSLIRLMIDTGKKACYVRDKNGWLPVHIACSRHCSPEKLNMLLDVHPSSLHAKTPDGESLLCLATSRATKTHPNYALISQLKDLLKNWNGNEQGEEEEIRSNAVKLECPSPGRKRRTRGEKRARAAGTQPHAESSFLNARHMVTPDIKPLDSYPRIEPNESSDNLAHTADLLLHFHRTGKQQDEEDGFSGQYAEV